MHRMLVGMTAATALVALSAFAAPAHAAIYYPWCANYAGQMGGASNCGFVSLEQCRGTVNGIDGFCVRNPFYTGPADGLAHPHRKRAGH